MARFTVRVQLRDVEGDSPYDTLHDEMEQRGFTRTIESKDGTEYELPTGSYNYEGERTIGQVLDRAKAAANATGHDSRILVTEAKARKWRGLKAV